MPDPQVPDAPPDLVVAISSRALFDLDESNRVFETQGVEAYQRYQIEREDEPLQPGEAFPFVRKLLALNARLQAQRVEVILLSRNTADTGLRVFNSIQHHGLDITRAAFCGGASPYRYVQAFGCHLFLSTDGGDVANALAHGVAAARLVGRPGNDTGGDELRIAFDGDAVLFSDEAERVYLSQGLDEFARTERESARDPLAGGPFKGVLQAIHRLQQSFDRDHCPLRTALVTARSAPAHERVVRTLRAWEIRLDESLFLGGLDKGAFLQAFGADVFFDDQVRHIESAGVAAGHVPHGVANEHPASVGSRS